MRAYDHLHVAQLEPVGLVRAKAGVRHERHVVVRILTVLALVLALRIERAFARSRVKLRVLLGIEPVSLF